jgi:4-hydroxy-tetrahydrodipicolinate synthase
MLSGVYAALLTPWDSQGNVDFAVHDQILDFVLQRGVDGVVIGGGTGEYPHLSFSERAELISRTARHLQGRTKMLVSIGTSSLHTTVKLGECAIAAGSDALLVPMPYFFRYEQHDLKTFCETVCRALRAPCLLYNLPSFTNVLRVETAIQLLLSEENLVGMKDSSGDKGNLQRLAQARAQREFSLFVGDDSLLFDALEAGWDGVISGIACFVPELVGALFRNFKAGNHQRACQVQDQLHKLIREILKLPIPWGIRVGLTARGLRAGDFPLPLSDLRRQQVVRLHDWLLKWFNELPEGLGWGSCVRVEKPMTEEVRRSR